MVIDSLTKAFLILDRQRQGVPFEAIKYIDELNSGNAGVADQDEPYNKKRESWENFYAKSESRFYDDVDEPEEDEADRAEKPLLFQNKKPGRNELCPCGSGRKFKKYHGK